MDHIIAVEGFAGYPFWQKRVPKNIETKNDLLFGLGPSQVINFVIPLFASRPGCVWTYYPQFMVWPITWKVHAIQKTKKPEDRIILIGFSYGGNAVHAVSHCFRETVFDLVISLDPVGKWRLNVAPDDPKAYGFHKPNSVKRWINIYQRFDRCSFAPYYPWLIKPIWGGKIQGADRETELFRDDFQQENVYNDGITTHGLEIPHLAEQPHMWFPAHNEVRRQITTELERF